MLSTKKQYYSFVYDSLFKEAKAIISPNYAKDVSVLSVVNELKLEGCKYKYSMLSKKNHAFCGDIPKYCIFQKKIVILQNNLNRWMQILKKKKYYIVIRFS